VEGYCPLKKETGLQTVVDKELNNVHVWECSHIRKLQVFKKWSLFENVERFSLRITIRTIQLFE
jgi:hypothetical protein